MLQVIFRKRATNYRALSRKMTNKEKVSYDSTPPCSVVSFAIGWLRLVGSLKLQVSSAKEPHKRDLYSAKATCNFKKPTNRSHPISLSSTTVSSYCS